MWLHEIMNSDFHLNLLNYYEVMILHFIFIFFCTVCFLLVYTFTTELSCVIQVVQRGLDNSNVVVPGGEGFFFFVNQ